MVECKNHGMVTCLLFIFFMLFGCSDGMPGASDANPIIEEFLEDTTDGRITLGNLRKIDGTEHAEYGVSVYDVTLEGTLEFTERCYWLADRMWLADDRIVLRTVSYEEGQQALEEIGYWDQFRPGTLRNRIQRYNLAERGDRIDFTANILFEKTDRGWIYSDGPRLILQ